MPRPTFAQQVDHQSSETPPTTAQKGANYGDHSSTYWTSGWNFDRYSKATITELLALPEDELAKMQAGLREGLGGEDGMAALAEYLFQQEQEREKAVTTVADTGATTTTTTTTTIMTETSGQQQQRPPLETQDTAILPPPRWLQYWQKHCGSERGQWGFAAIRTTCYDDETRWHEFKTRFQKVVEMPFSYDADSREPGVAEAKATFQILWIENDPRQLDGANVATLRNTYADLRPDLPAGLSQNVFLWISSDVVESILGNDDDTAAAEVPQPSLTKRWRPSAPYVLAVAADADPGLEEGHEERRWFRPVFKVAAEVLVDEFWWLLDSNMMPLRRITRGVKGVGDEEAETGAQQDDGVHDLEEMWWSTAPSPARLKKRRQLG
jgi:hypothetical protein